MYTYRFASTEKRHHRSAVRWIAVASFIASALMPGSSSAWDGYTSGRIQTIEVTQINNFPFRVQLEGGPVLCTGGHGWAYLDGNGTNYKVFATALLAARAQGIPVALYTTNDSSGVSYCRIDHLAY